MQRRPRKLLDQVREAIRLKHYSIRAEQSYVSLERKYPDANREWIWQYVCLASKLSQDPRTGVIRRRHVS
ncbi:hypothetical protein M1O17_00925 [Dehalococcoidia bacterium]|nr:hypothetical protein [Dehalococcoidia bacterium]